MKYFAPTRLSENIHETPEGYLLCTGVSIGRVGEMVYAEEETPLEADASGKVIVTRDAADLFSPETMASFEGKALTIRHPEEFVGPDNWKDLAKGVIQNVRRGKGDQKDDLVADILVTDKIAIGLVKQGVREVSCGYEAEYEQIDEGKGRQTKIIGNHLALVREGRAGPAYAINDHKGKGTKSMKKLGEKIKELFAKAGDEAAKAIDEDMPVEKEKAKDEPMAGYDELVKMVKDLGAKIEGMAKPKDEAKPAEEKKPEEKAKDEPKPEPKAEEKKDEAKDEPSVEERLKALELAVSKMMEGESEEESADEDDGEEEEMADEESDVEAEDEDEAEPVVLTGDEASRAEILAPGIKPCKDIKSKALKKAYESEEGKAAIDKLTGGKPTFDSADKVDMLFVAASEVLKASRTSEFSASKKSRDFFSTLDNREGVMTPEKMNEMNAARYKTN